MLQYNFSHNLSVTGITAPRPVCLPRLAASGMLVGISPSDPMTIAGSGLFLVAVTLLASYLPARRATQIDPMVALRCQ